MGEVLDAFPGAQRALFRRYHIGGCSLRISADGDAGASLRAQRWSGRERGPGAHPPSHEQDAKVLISPKELAELLKCDKSVKLVDVRSREEFEAVKIEGSILLSQDVMRELMASGSNPDSLW